MKRFGIFTSVICFLVLVLFPTAGNAQASFNLIDTVKIEEVIVTGTRVEVSGKKVPLTVALITQEEIELLKGDQIIISAIHVAVQTPEFIRALMRKKVTAIAFEYLKDQHNSYSIVRSMSEIAGSTSILIAAEYLSNIRQGKGEMLGGITGVKPSEIIIIGAGSAAECAARTAIGLGAMVKVFDDTIFRLRRLQYELGLRIFTSVLQPKVLSSALRTADVVIGAKHLIDQRPKYYITEEMVQNMKPHSVIIDISIDQGGCCETSQITSHSNPVFRKHGVVHYCVPNIPSRVARTASYAISNVFAPILQKLGEAGSIKQFLKENIGMRHGIYIYNGILTNEYIGSQFGISSQDIDLLMAAF